MGQRSCYCINRGGNGNHPARIQFIVCQIGFRQAGILLLKMKLITTHNYKNMNNDTAIKEMVKENMPPLPNSQKIRIWFPAAAPLRPVAGRMYNIMSEDYSKLEGYNPDADLGLGCGLPTEFAQISEGDTVIDLGSGAGNDCFVARKLAGEKGRVLGIDFTPAMIDRARVKRRKTQV